MASITTTANVDALKRWYSPKRIRDMMYDMSPLFMALPKTTDFGGSAKGYAIKVSGPAGGRSHTFATAQANKTAGTEKQWLLTRIKDYGLVSIEQEALLAAASDKHAFLNLGRGKIDDLLKIMGGNIATSLYKNGGGSRGQVGSTSTTTLTLKNIRDVVNFEVGMFLDSSATDGTSGSADGGQKQITAINRKAGTLTAATNWTSAANFSDDDYIFQEGDFGGALAGLDSWLPATAPTSTLHFNVDRSVDTDRLGGIRIDGSTKTNVEAIMEADSEVSATAGGSPDVCFMNPNDLLNTKLELGAKVEYDLLHSDGGRGDFSFKVLQMHGTKKPIKLVSDHYCPSGVAYLLQMDTWELATLGQAPDLSRALGAFQQWDTTADSVEIRARMYGNLVCVAPGYNARITLAS